MKHLKIFIELTRLNKPIGFMLLFWPCSWGLAYSYNVDQNLNIFILYMLLFFLGAVFMRSAGCIFNDIVDKDFDKKVQRTKRRPIASGQITINKSIQYILLLCVFDQATSNDLLKILPLGHQDLNETQYEMLSICR